MAVKVHGVSLHYFNEKANSDKYYRVFIWPDNLNWHVTYHWGRDGASGQSKTETFGTESAVKRLLDRKVNEKLNKGYQFLGQGDIEIDAYDVVQDVHKVGELLQSRVGREPLKLPTGFQLVIREEDDIEDLVCRRSA